MDLDELERLAREATPGPWRADQEFGYVHPSNDRNVLVCTFHDELVRDTDGADAAYIAAVSPDVVLALVAEIRALRVTTAREGVTSWSPPFPSAAFFDFGAVTRGLSVRIANCVHNQGITSAQALAVCDPAAMRRWKNVGGRCIVVMKAALLRSGVELHPGWATVPTLWAPPMIADATKGGHDGSD
jgi:hypothetical protein